MEVIKLPNQKIKFNYGTVDKYAVVVGEEIVYVGSEPQCRRWVFYMEGSSMEEILDRKRHMKDLVS
jgi:hypothetical protein